MTTITITTAAKRAAIPAVLTAAILLATAGLASMEEPSMPTPDLNTAPDAVPAVTEAETAIVIHPQVLPAGPMTRLVDGTYADSEGYVYVLKRMTITRPDGVKEIREFFSPDGTRLPF